MTDPAADGVLLSSGQRARVVPLDDGWALEVDGIRQSHVGAADAPSPHASVRWMLAALSGVLGRPGGGAGTGTGAGAGAGSGAGAWSGPDVPVVPRVAHVGGAAMSLPRQVARARPDAVQTVVELERAIVELVVAHAPPPAGVDVVVGDGRAWLESTAPASWDAIAIDVYAGGRIPPAFTSIECAAAARAALRADGVLVVNGVAGPDLAFTAAHVASLRSAFAHVSLIVQGSVLAGARFGNAVLVASAASLASDAVRAALAGDASRGAFVADAVGAVGAAEALRDTDERWSPAPVRSAFIPPAS